MAFAWRGCRRFPLFSCNQLRFNEPFVREVAMGAFDVSGGAFSPTRHYASVTMQQGRVQLDADSDEDSEANSEKIKRLTADTATPAADAALTSAVGPLSPADPMPLDDGTTATLAVALAGFEPAGGLHPLANATVFPCPWD